jgi:hypothetical protein
VPGSATKPGPPELATAAQVHQLQLALYLGERLGMGVDVAEATGRRVAGLNAGGRLDHLRVGLLRGPIEARPVGRGLRAAAGKGAEDPGGGERHDLGARAHLSSTTARPWPTPMQIAARP